MPDTDVGMATQKCLLHRSLLLELHIWPRWPDFQNYWSAGWPVLQGHLGWCLTWLPAGDKV